MRRNSILCLIILVAGIFSCDTKKDFEEDLKNYYIRYYGEDGDQRAVDMVVNPDGTMLLLGNSAVPGSKSHLLIWKVGEDGRVIWQRRFGSGLDRLGRAVDEFSQDIERTEDGHYLVLSNMLRGKDVASNDDLYDFKVLRINDSGQLLDSLEFGNNTGNLNDWKSQWAKSLTPLANGGFAVTGTSNNENLYDDNWPPGSVETDVEDLFALVFNSDHSIAWSTVELNEPKSTLYASHVGSGIKVFQNASEFYLFSHSDCITDEEQGERYESNFNVITLSSDGISNDEVHSVGDNFNQEVLASVCQVPESLGGGFFELGTTSTTSTPQGGLYFCRRTKSLARVASGVIQGLAGTFTAVTVAPAPYSDGFFVLANERTVGGSTMRIIKLNLNSDVLWSVNIGAFDQNNQGASIAELPDRRIVLLGTIELETQEKVALIKLNSHGELLN